MSGAFTNCCCGTPDYARRSIWTRRPFGTFLRPFDAGAWAADTDVDVLGGEFGTDVIGTTKARVGVGEPRYYPWPRPVGTPTNADITWEGTRYAQETKITTWNGTYGEDGDPYYFEQRVCGFIDLNTGYVWVLSEWTVPPPESHVSGTEGYSTSYEETMTETSWSRVNGYQYLTITETVTRETPVTWAGQQARCKDHLDYVLGTMTASKLRNTMSLVGTPNRDWPYSPFGVTDNHGYMEVTPITGTFEIVDGAGVYTEWELSSEQVLTWNSFASQTNMAINGAAKNFGSIYVDPGLDEFATFAVSAGRIQFDDSILDDAEVVMQYVCISSPTPFNCTDMGTTHQYTEIVQATAADQPAWGASEACFGTEKVGAPGWYFFSPDGVVYTPLSGTNNYTVPGTDGWILNVHTPVCCPP